jgi:hypothetical protein
MNDPTIQSAVNVFVEALAVRVVELLLEKLPDRSAADEYLSTKEAAKILHMSCKGLEGLRAKGEGPKFVRVGGSIRYRRSDLMKLLAA